ncbi:hypothetical protein SAIL_19240 [Streptococcus agalactiae ILRI112]|nr:hypothetical protein SAIL_19240 [Streptococcus agalactiae ILRI112]
MFLIMFKKCNGSVVGSRTVMSTGRLAKNYLGLIRKSR